MVSEGLRLTISEKTNEMILDVDFEDWGRLLRNQEELSKYWLGV